MWVEISLVGLSKLRKNTVLYPISESRTKPDAFKMPLLTTSSGIYVVTIVIQIECFTLYLLRLLINN
jgi:hypothetical protein